MWCGVNDDPPRKTNTMTKLEIKGDWNITKGKLKQKWATLTDDDLQYVEGKSDELLGRIQKRIGESREAVEKAVKEAWNRVAQSWDIRGGAFRPSPSNSDTAAVGAEAGSKARQPPVAFFIGRPVA